MRAYFYPLDIRDSGQKDLEPNMQTNRKTTANEAMRMSGRISEIRDINVIKPIPRRHRLLYLLDIISWLLEAVQFLIVPATHCARVSDSDLPDGSKHHWGGRRRRRRKEEKKKNAIQSSGGRYFQVLRLPSVNTGRLHPITSAVRHQQMGERRERTPIRGSGQWERSHQWGRKERSHEQVESLTNLLCLLQYAARSGKLAASLWSALVFAKKRLIWNADVKIHTRCLKWPKVPTLNVHNYRHILIPETNKTSPWIRFN